MKPMIRNWMRKAYQEDKKALKEILAPSVFEAVDKEAKERKQAKKEINEHRSASKNSVED